MLRRTRVLILAALALSGLAATRTPRPATADPAATRPAGAPPAGATAGTPRLVVLVVIDQFRADYLDRLGPRFGPDGFRRLERTGTRFTECAHDYALTETGPGHATLATGADPDRHGIVSNDFFDLGTHKVIASVDDPRFPLVGAAGAGVSPRRLMVDTLGDSLRLATRGAAKVWSIAGKDRSAVFSVGRGANGALWYDINSGLIVTTRYYMEALPAWAAQLNAEHPADRLLQETGAKNYDFLRGTPQFHDLMFDCARHIVTSERLGEDATPDLLVVGLSGVDILGHQVGPYDERLERLILRLDAQLGAFLRFLDERVGAGRTIVALSADHGVAPTRDQAESAGLRFDGLEEPRLLEAMQRALAARAGNRPPPRLYGDTPTRIWFDRQELDRAGLDLEQAAEAAGAGALSIDGVFGYLTAVRSTVDAATRAAYERNRFEGRSPDLFIVPTPFAIVGEDAPATHGTPWSYDRRVPLLLAGGPFRARIDPTPCTPADVAPTLAAALHIPPPAGATGRVLH
jgi:predicted AlkP superfamily pyrophosphatase or phosphodiesterase